MKVALPIWNGRLSPVLDTARTFLVTEFDQAQERSRTALTLEPALPWHRANQLAQMEVNELICGAVSRELAMALAGMGVRVIPFVTGELGEVLEAYVADRLGEPRFAMPGCSRRRLRFRGPRGHGRGGRCFRRH